MGLPPWKTSSSAHALDDVDQLDGIDIVDVLAAGMVAELLVIAGEAHDVPNA